jgi:hypothetical protein
MRKKWFLALLTAAALTAAALSLPAASATAVPADADVAVGNFVARDHGLALGRLAAAMDADKVPATTETTDQFSEPFACSGYTGMAWHVTEAGNVYRTDANVCGFYYDLSSIANTGTVARFKCYRNGQLYGAGAGGCRWLWNQITQYKNSSGNWVTVISNNLLLPDDGTFAADSGRVWGESHTRYSGYSCRGAIRSTTTTDFRVRFKLADGSEVVKHMYPDPLISGTWGRCALY